MTAPKWEATVLQRRVLAAIASWLLTAPALACAQSFNLAPVVGAMQFDAGQDAAYFTWGVQARYFVVPSFRVGLTFNTAHIGDPPRVWTAPGTDQQFWRVGAMAEFATAPFHKGAVAIRGLLGVNHSSGVIYQGPEAGFEQFWGITDSPTGISYGGGLGLEVGPYSRIRLMLEGNIWMDNSYGGSGFDPELLFGLSVDL